MSVQTASPAAHAPSAREPRAADRVDGGFSGILAAIAAVVAWAVLVVAVEFISEHGAHMDTGSAWGYAAGIVSYIFMFTGFVVGLIALIQRSVREESSR